MKTKTFYYKDHGIDYTAGFYWALGKPFKTKVAAEKEIDKSLVA